MAAEKVENITPYRDRRSKESQVEQMFDNIAPNYDFLNRAMSLGLDRLWLRALLNTVKGFKPSVIADLATGTGDVAFALSRTIPEARILGFDLSEGMLRKAAQKIQPSYGSNISFTKADCLNLPLADASVDLATIAYGIRNFADIAAGAREAARILRSGGTFAILELSAPRSPIIKPLYRLYTKGIIPFLGKIISGDGKAYTYLPDSIAACPQGTDMCNILLRNGFESASFRILAPGVCTLYLAHKA